MPRSAAVAAAVAALVGILASCSFPEPTSVEEGDGGAGTTTTSESGTTTGTTDRDAAACADECDCDKDGVKASGPKCGGPDCDDFDDRAKPSARFSEAPPAAPLNGNWNCDDQTEKRWPGDINCTTNCTGVGFTGKEPGCGEEGDWVECEAVAAPAVCRPKAQAVKKRQQCR